MSPPDLHALEDALASRDRDRVETALLALWRAHPDPRLSLLFQQFAHYAESLRTWPVQSAAIEEAAQDAIDRAERLLPVLAWVRKGRSGDDVAFRFERTWPHYVPDPRLTTFAFDLLRNSPSQRNQPLDDAIWSCLDANRDPDSTRQVGDVVERPEKVGVWRGDREYPPFRDDGFGRRFNRRLADFPGQAARWRTAPLAAELLADLTERIEAFVDADVPEPEPLDALFTRICERPDDLGARAEFADHCLETGDTERGELIHLQLRKSKLTPTEQAKVRKILKRRQKEWLGAAHAVIDRESLRFKHGFPHAATLKRASANALEKSVGGLGWRTMRDLTVLVKHDTWLDIVDDPTGHNVHTLRGPIRRWFPEIESGIGARLRVLDLVPGAEPKPPHRTARALRLQRLRTLRISQRDLALVDTLETRNPLKRLHLTVLAIPRTSELSPLVFALDPARALEWFLEHRESISGRSELRFTDGDQTFLELHTRRGEAGWEIAAAIGDHEGALDAVLESIGSEIVVRRRV